MFATTLAEIAARTTTVWGGLRTRRYSMFDPRNDCSSFVAEVLGLDNPLAWSTVSLPDVLIPISFEEAEPGDMWGHIGPGTGGPNGHIATITGTPASRGDGRWEVVQQSGPTGTFGPTRNTYPHPPDGYLAYRSIYVQVNIPAPQLPGEDQMRFIVDDGTDSRYETDGFLIRPIHSIPELAALEAAGLKHAGTVDLSKTVPHPFLNEVRMYPSAGEIIITDNQVVAAVVHELTN